MLEAGRSEDFLQLGGRKLLPFGRAKHHHGESSSGPGMCTRIVNKHLVQVDAATGCTSRKCLRGQLCADVRAPIVEDVGKKQRIITLRPMLSEHVHSNRFDTIADACCCNVVVRKLAHRLQVHHRRAQLRMMLGDGN